MSFSLVISQQDVSVSRMRMNRILLFLLLHFFFVNTRSEGSRVTRAVFDIIPYNLNHAHKSNMEVRVKTAQKYLKTQHLTFHHRKRDLYNKLETNVNLRRLFEKWKEDNQERRSLSKTVETPKVLYFLLVVCYLSFI